MSTVVKVLLALLLLALLETPAVVEHSRRVELQGQLSGLQKRYDAATQAVGVLRGQLSQSQADLASSQQAVRVANASIDSLRAAAENAAAEEAAFRLKVAAQQATYGKIIATRDQQIASLKAQQEGCDEAIADLRAGQ